MRKYFLSDQAKEDLLAIFSYTLETWGEEQVPIYLNIVETAIERIADNPLLLGSKAPEDLSPGCRIFRSDKHFIIYQIMPPRIGIARILHESMDFSRHIDERAFD